MTKNKNVAIFPNITKDIDLTYTKVLIEYLKNKGYDIYLEQELSNRVDGVSYRPVAQVCEICEFGIVLGGDGSILSKATVASKYDIPILGINLGSVGYLTDVEKEQGIEAIEKYLQGNYVMEKRMMIETVVEEKIERALNEICVVKGSFSKIITLDINVNGEYIDTYRADGILISTPSGSTAYNLAAGGPIVKPDLDVMVITPICPYKLITRPLVVNGNDVVKISALDYRNVIISIDGISKALNEPLTITKSNNYLKIIRTSTHNFHHSLRTKLGTL